MHLGISMLLFIHGLSAHADEWKDFVEFFSEKGFSCRAVELREGKNLRKTSFRDYVKTVVDMVGLDDIIVGHSMGGLIVQKVAEETKVKAAISISPAPPKGVKSLTRTVPWYYMIRYIPNIIFNRPFKLSYSFYKNFLANGLNEEKIRRIHEHDGVESAKVALELSLNRISVNPSKISCPILFITAREDRVSPPDVVKRVADMYNADLKIIDGSHYIFDNWHVIAEEILRFIESI
ncbi:MAG: hypothetical protein DRN12_07155 [Thermoplasmata archaeon]|nr:MAG: hypothetical protein DRN12_07155 [Thermoplasmata archaeon]HEC88979.1 alpha/beta hydrolase [Thermoplasmatales archaeon]